LKLLQILLWHLHLICLARLTQERASSATNKEKKKIFHIQPFFYFFNQQTNQPPKSKSNPKKVIQNSNQAMEEEDLSFPDPFFSSISKQHKPQTLKTTQSKLFKMQLQLFFFYHTTKNPPTFPSKHPNPTTNHPLSYAQNSLTSTLPHILQIPPKKQTNRLNQSKKYFRTSLSS